MILYVYLEAPKLMEKICRGKCPVSNKEAKKSLHSWAWCNIPEIPELRRLREEYFYDEVRARQGCILRLPQRQTNKDLYKYI